MPELSDGDKRLAEKYGSDALIIEAETLEECGEYLHMSLMGHSPEELREMAECAKSQEN